NKYIFEIGGKNKTFKQIRSEKDSYVAFDNMEIGFKRKIPLWIFILNMIHISFYNKK
nr:hypothetical protein [Candidatus Anoxychlamydiales bacterium]